VPVLLLEVAASSFDSFSSGKKNMQKMRAFFATFKI
jgi:hypothetical protein